MLHSWGSKKLVCILCFQGSFKWTQQATTCQGNSKATRKPPCPYLPHTQYPTKAPLLTCSVSQSLNLYIKTNWFNKERPGVLWSTFNIFPASSITISMSQPYLGWRVSRFPVALQRYLFIQSCFLLAPWKMILVVWSGERMQQTPRDPVTQSSRGDAWLRWDSGLELHWNRSALLNIKNTWLLLVHKCLRRFYDDQGRGSI